MSTTSATGGYLVPVSVNGDLNDNALADFLQTAIAGITGLPGAVVRPRWQPEPPDIPPYGTNWCGLGVVSRRPDKFTYTRHNSTGFDRTYRQELLEILCSFYGPSSETNAELLSVGLQVSQNLEAMSLAGYGLVEVDDPLTVPELLNQRWQMRVDLGFKLRRVQIYDYPVLNLGAAQGTVVTDQQPVQQNITANLQTVVTTPQFAFDIGGEFTGGFDTGHWGK